MSLRLDPTKLPYEGKPARHAAVEVPGSSLVAALWQKKGVNSLGSCIGLPPRVEPTHLRFGENFKDGTQ